MPSRPAKAYSTPQEVADRLGFHVNTKDTIDEARRRGIRTLVIENVPA